MAELKIRVSAAADPSLKTVFKPIEEAAAKASQAARRGAADSARAAKDQASSADKAAAAQAKAAERAATAHARAQQRVERQLARMAQAEQKAAQQSAQAAIQAEQRKTQAVMREFDRRLAASKRARDAEEREIVRSANKAHRAEQRAAQQQSRQQQYDTNRLRHDMGHRAVNNLNAMGRGAIGLGRDIAGGMGVDFSLGGAVGRNVEMQRRITQLSNAGYIPSEGKGRIETGKIEGVVKSATDSTGFSRLQGLDALEKFVAKTGELQMGLDMLQGIGTLAQASGADLGDLADAAGDVASAMGNVEDKSKRAQMTQQVLRTIAGQGKIGAVEVKDLATQMAKVATSATAFQGDTASNIGFMGALTQMSRATGGSASATQAATSVTAFVNTLRTPARMNAFKEAGIDILDKQTGEFRDPEQIVLASLSQTQGDPMKWKKLFANVQGARAVEGAATLYRRSRASALEGGATEEEANLAGLSSVKAEFEKFRSIAMGDKEVQDSFAARMQNDDVKAQQFQNRLDDVAQKMQRDLVPAFEKLAPHVVKVAEAFAGLVSWAAENPGKAITAAIVGSIAKAGLETAFAAGVERMMGGTGGPLGPKMNKVGSNYYPSMGGPSGGSGLSTAGAGFAIAAAAVTITAAGVELIDQGMKSREAADAGVRSDLGSATEMGVNALVAARAGEITSEQFTGLQGELARLDAQIAAGEQANSWGTKLTRGNLSALSGVANWATAGEYGTSFDRQSADAASGRQIEELRALRAETAQRLAAVEAAVIRNAVVQISNLPGMGALVDQAGRASSFVGSFFGG